MAIDSDQKLSQPGVVLTGASGQIGWFAIPRLLSAGFRVIAVSRNGKPQNFPHFDQIEWLNMADALTASIGCDHLLSAGPMSLALQFLQQKNTFKSAVVFSSSSVESKLDSANPAENNQIQSMLSDESALQLFADKSTLRLVIFRPTLIYGCGLDTNISRLAQWVNRFGFIPVNGKATGKRQPVHADDLASAAISTLCNTEPLPGVMSLTGGETLSYLEMVSRIFTAMEKSPRLVRLPQWAFASVVRLVGILGILKGVNAEMVKRQKVDLIFDDQQARELLNYRPRKFHPTKDDFLIPEFD